MIAYLLYTEEDMPPSFELGEDKYQECNICLLWIQIRIIALEKQEPDVNVK